MFTGTHVRTYNVISDVGAGASRIRAVLLAAKSEFAERINRAPRGPRISPVPISSALVFCFGQQCSGYFSMESERERERGNTVGNGWDKKIARDTETYLFTRPD